MKSSNPSKGVPAAPPPPPPPPAAHDDVKQNTASKSADDRAQAHLGDAVPGQGPFQFPLLGNVPQIAQKGTISFLEDAWKKYGDVFRVNIMGPALVVCHPDGLQRVLAGNKDNYIKGDAYNGVRAVIGEGLIALEGHEWRKRRTLIQPQFHHGALLGLINIIIEQGALFFDDLKSRHPKGGVLDVHPEMVKLTLDVVVNALFGSGLEKETDVNYESLGLALELVSERTNGTPIPDWVPTPSNRKFKRVMRDVEGAVYKVIEATKARSEKQDTLLQMLLDARDAETGEALSDVEIRNEVFTLFIAGHETTALTLSWLFTLVTPEVIEKLQAEIADVLGDRDPTFDDIGKLIYTRQVVDEVLRLRCPVAMVARNALADDNICGVEVKKGDMILPFFWAAHRHPDFWERPLEFDPDRFAPEKNAQRDKWSYLPFSAGQRVCIGNTFSLYETTLLLVMMMRRFDFRLVPGQKIEPNMIATVRPSAPVQVEITWKA
ncbi:MAG: cytochrome P450 [Deltaproteobacteria bacterium]|nr:cytochrome P450 [Deltaproteobacteria bacterium]